MSTIIDLYAKNPFKHNVGEKLMGFEFPGSRLIYGTIVDRKHYGRTNAYIIDSEYGKNHGGALYESSIIPFDEKILQRELEKDKMLTIRILFDFGTSVIVDKDEKEIFWQNIDGDNIDPDNLLETYKKLLAVLGYKPLLDEMYCGDGLYVLKFEKEKEDKDKNEKEM